MYFPGDIALPTLFLSQSKLSLISARTCNSEKKNKARTEFSLVRIFLIRIYCITDFGKFNLIPSLLLVCDRKSAYVSLKCLYIMNLATFSHLLMLHIYPGSTDNTTEATLTT